MLIRRAFRYHSLMSVGFRHLLGWVLSVFRSREELLLENLEPATSEKIAERIRPLLPRRPDASRTAERHARRSSCGVGVATRERDHLAAATRWTAPPLHGRCLSNLRKLYRSALSQHPS